LITGAGSRETIELAAKFGFTYQAILTPRPILLKNCQLFRDLSEEHGTGTDPRRIAAVLTVHTAETDAQARQEIERHGLWAMQNILRFPFHESFPPGHVSSPSLRAMMSGGYRSTDPSKATWEQMEAHGFIAGSPETVKQKIADITGAMGAGRVIVGNEFTVPMWLQEKSMSIFAEEVMPSFRAPGALASWQREERIPYQTAAERVGRHPHKAGVPTVAIDGVYEPLLDY
jgi:alkanesulfonate monooxygenase SsuD/methylene tetrahydromethanopterin reductase-like flavin-dependent oxidoreductase (luciferase family)